MQLGVLSQVSDLDYISCARSYRPPKSKPMSSTSRKIPLGMTVRFRLSSVTESHSCGTVKLSQPSSTPNRLDICRYLSKLCDQLICLLSSEHSRAISWGDENDGAEREGNGDDSDGASTDSEKGDFNRFYHFEVAKTKDQEENVVVREGFKVRLQYNRVTQLIQVPLP
jgi:hypothetical protein